ncbi:MAG: diacylglycerol kinase [Burkholderiales bacterium]|nr:diacylglycerol kinase [Burkholderiales bacterium]
MSDSPSRPPAPSVSAFKSRSGLGRLWRALGYSWAGLRDAVRYEAAFRQELAVGLPLVALAWVIAPGRLQALALTAVIVFVWVVELLNSALEALADTVTIENHPLIARAKDMGSAAVMLSLVLAALVWGVVLWP